jgi:hypothetical protein
VLPTVTVNFGGRFDAITGAHQREPVQPASSTSSWEPTPAEISSAGGIRPLLSCPPPSFEPVSVAVRSPPAARHRSLPPEMS